MSWILPRKANDWSAFSSSAPASNASSAQKTPRKHHAPRLGRLCPVRVNLSQDQTRICIERRIAKHAGAKFLKRRRRHHAGIVCRKRTAGKKNFDPPALRALFTRGPP